MQKKLLKYYYLFLLYPVLILTIVVNLNTYKSFQPERIIFFYLLFYFIAYFINNKTIKSIYVRFIYICSVILSFVEIGYVTLYKERITSSTAFILMETNSEEVKEYLQEYLNGSIIMWMLLLFIPSIFILIGVNKLIHQLTFKETLLAIGTDLKKVITNNLALLIQRKLITIYKNRWKKVILGAIILFLFTVIYIKDNHHKYNALYQLYNGRANYLEEVEKYKAFLKSDLKNAVQSTIKHNTPNNIKETYVLIIGESTNKNHLGIYNYYRNTSPQLNNLKNELVIFNNVISPHTHTIPALEKVLTFGNRENPDAKYNGSIIQLMKKAGFKTYWISNQVPIGINETLVAIMAKASHYTHFTNLGGEKQLRTFDERVLPYFKKTIQDTATKKFIVIHLLGTHTQYKNRYPRNYNKFKDIPPTQFPSEKAYSTINEYDNAVLYNDYVITSIIQLLKENTKQNEKTFALYFSDHGEDVFETVDFTGHSEVIGSKPMFQIPFIYWSNNKSDIEKFKNYSNRNYMTDDLIYSIANLTNISFMGMDKTRSIFNDSLQKRPRIIKENIDFDIYFKNN